MQVGFWVSEVLGFWGWAGKMRAGMKRALVVLPVLALACFGTLSASPAADPASPDLLLAAYAKGDYQVIERALKGADNFDRFRKALGYEKDGKFYGALAQWHLDRHPAQSVFMLDLAFVAFNHNWPYWLDVLEEARKFVTGRREPPGLRPDDDAFEIAWHKTSIALLFSGRRPDLIQKNGLGPLAQRMAAAPLETGEPRLIDPWIALARGMAEEQMTFVNRASLPVRAPAALRYFDEAAAFESTRAEALVRKAWILVRLGRPAEALTALDLWQDRANDPSVLYWGQLFRGRAFEDLDVLAEAARAYGEALRLVPDAQAPMAALVALELRRNDQDRAYHWATSALTAPTNAIDPWWDYAFCDFRLFKTRLAALRGSVR